jgi:dye decolorizing peroxidase
MRRARMSDRSQRIARRGHSFVDVIDGETVSGLLFGSFQRDVTAQFVPIQESLAKADMLNIWTTPVGSAVFAIPPGCAEGGFVGETLFI